MIIRGEGFPFPADKPIDLVECVHAAMSDTSDAALLHTSPMTTRRGEVPVDVTKPRYVR